jgi:RimJ/RimL family protein N-acetyltransferase
MGPSSSNQEVDRVNPDQEPRPEAQAGSVQPPHPPETLVLRDGTEVIIRAILPEDAPLLQELFRRLSPESIFLRFLTRLKELSQTQAERFARVDYQSQMALVATLGPDIIGVARYAPSMDHEPGMAEAAVVVQDEYQSRGLGTLLLMRLSDYARQHGVKAFVASIHQSNERILHFIRKSGLRTESRIDAGLWQIRVYLD